MRGDETRPVTAGSEEVRERRGGRHAAPRKSLLTKLQIPAGKAMALAAMPTAVFVGMGLSPRLALADDNGDIPYAPGPCVTRSDEPSTEASESEPPKPDTSPSGSPSGAVSEPSADPASPSPSASASTGDRGSTEPKPSASASASASASPTPSGSPGAAKDHKPADPLGLGGLLGGLLGGGSAKETPAADEPSSEPPSKPASEPSSKPEKDDPIGKAGDAVGETVGETVDDTVGKTADATKQAIKDAADRAGATVEELGDEAKGLEAHADDDIPEGADGKEPFPCPTADPEALANAKEEQGIPLLPDDPWTLHSSMLTLKGLDYEGIVEVRTANGSTKKALKFTSSSLDIKDLHQTTVYPGGKTAHVKARAGSNSTIRDGEVTLYTEELKGNLFGLVPITFSPETPPPVNIPFAFFTDVTVIQAGQFGGTLSIPGLHNYITD
ncbi:hypothetical protein [Streptomyces sp. NPDC088725]|uniref:hypothetical protein n=1 Tax=Streptomyces sp. NPDC088725 TaxID=3365873 RepID=UPI00381680A5